MNKILLLALTIVFSMQFNCYANNSFNEDTVVLKKRISKKPKKIDNNELTPAHKGVKGLVFRIEVSENDAFNIKNKAVAGVRKIKTIEGDTRFVIGADFFSLSKAQFFCEKMKSASPEKPRVVASYKGKLISLDQLEKLGMF